MKIRGHPGLNQGPLDLQSNSLPLSYIPVRKRNCSLYLYVILNKRELIAFNCFTSEHDDTVFRCCEFVRLHLSILAQKKIALYVHAHIFL